MMKKIAQPLIISVLLLAMAYSFWFSQPWLQLCYGLALFLFGMQCIKEGLQNSVGGTLERLLSHSTSTSYKSFGFGILATFFLQSSTLVVLLSIAFLSTGMINLAGGIAVILGTNLGATSGIWMLALLGRTISLSAVAMPMLVFGIFLSFLKEKHFFIGRVLVGIALIFIGIDAIKGGFDEVDDELSFLAMQVTGVAEIVVFNLAGLLVTMALQSSHATLILTLALLSAGQIDLTQGFAIALGSNVGSSVTTAFVGVLGSDRSGQRLALAHLLFNIIVAIVVLILWVPLNRLVLFIGAEAELNQLLQLALFHTMINLMGAVIFWPVQGRFKDFLYRILPDKKEVSLIEDSEKTAGAIYLNQNLLRSGDTAFRAVFKELQHFSALSLEVLCHVLFIEPEKLYRSNQPDAKCAIESDLPTPPLELNAQQLYEAQIKPVYGDILDFMSKMEIDSDEHQQQLIEANIAVLRLVEIIKNAKHIQKNMHTYLQLPESAPHQDYVNLREYLFKILCLAYQIIDSNYGSKRWKRSMANLEQHLTALYNFRVRLMQKLRDGDLDGWQASSLMNDCNYARDIGHGLIEILAMPSMELLTTKEEISEVLAISQDQK